MLFPDAFLALTQRPEFWSQFFFETWGEEFPELDNCRLVFPVGRGYALTLDLDSSLAYFGLRLRHPGVPEPVEIAWDDQAHWHPHVLRWEELDLVCRCIALDDPSLPHPGLALALLHRFAPICTTDDDAVVHPLIAEAYRTVGAFSEPQITELVYRYDRRQNGFAWEYAEPHGWYPNAGDDRMSGLYSLRHPQNEEFPFTELNTLFATAREWLVSSVDPAWLAGSAGELARVVASTGDLSGLPVLADALQEAGCEVPTLLDPLRASTSPVRGCWVVETLLGTRPGEVIAKALGHTRRPPRVVYRFEFSFPVTEHERGVQPDRVDKILNAALREAGIGKAGCFGASSSGNPPRYELLVGATVNDEPDRGLAIIRDVLTRANAPRATVIRLTAPETATYPLAPGEPV